MEGHWGGNSLNAGDAGPIGVDNIRGGHIKCQNQILQILEQTRKTNIPKKGINCEQTAAKAKRKRANIADVWIVLEIANFTKLTRRERVRTQTC